MQNYLKMAGSKILDEKSLSHALARWRLMGQKIVFTNGCFDILHLGHIDYLAKAADEGDILLIGLNSDSSTNKLKGPHRPINDQHSRAMIIASLFFVSAVVIFDEPTPHHLISVVQPDILVKGGDYKADEIIGYDIVKAKNGIVKTLPFLDGYSTTSIEQKIKSTGKP